MKITARKLYQRVNLWTMAFVIGVSSLTAAVPFILSQKANADSPTNITVTAADTQGWTSAEPLATTKAGSAVTFATDNTTGTTGNGALKITTDSTTTTKAQYMKATGALALADVTGALSYSTKQNAPSPAYADASYQIQVFLNPNGAGSNTGYATLGYEPYVNYGNSALQPGVWQSWNVGNGKFYSSKTITNADTTGVVASQGSDLYTLAQIKQLFPNAQVIAFGLNVGGNNPNYNVEADNFTFNGVTYNFEGLSTPTFTNPTNNAIENDGNFNVAWTAVPGAVNYRTISSSSTDADANGTLIDTPANDYYAHDWGNTTSLSNLSLPDGTFYWQVQAEDANGEVSNWSPVTKVTIDSTAPAKPVAQNPNGWTNGATTYTWSDSSDTGTAVHYELQYSRTHPNNIAENGTITANTNSYTPAGGIADGPLFWRVRAIDAAGNTSDWSDIQAATIDATAPILTPDVTGGVFGGTKLITLNINEPYLKASAIRIVTPAFASVAATPGVYNGNGTGNPLSYAWNTKLVNDGAYKIQYSATDVLGHSTAAFYDVTVDNTAPAVVFTNHANNDVVSGNVTVNGSVTDLHPSVSYMTVTNDSTHQVVAEQNVNTGLTSPSVSWDSSTAADGTYTVHFEAKDIAGNETNADSVKNITLVVDNTAPTVAFTTPHDGDVVSGTITVAGTVTDAHPSVSYITVSDSANHIVAVQNVNTAQTAPSLDWNTKLTADGVYKIHFEAKDTQGNETLANSVKDITVTVDNSAPVVAITGPADGALVKGTVAVTGTVTDLHPSVSYMTITNNATHNVVAEQNVNTALTNPSITWNTKLSDDGEYTIHLEAKDTQGNETLADSVRNITVTVDNTAPVAPTITSSLSQFINVGSVTIDWNAIADAAKYRVESSTTSDFATVIGSVETTDPTATITGAFPEGIYYLRVIATDAAGNESTASATTKVVVDYTAPVVAITAPTTGSALKGIVTIKGSLIDVNPDHYYLVVKNSNGVVVAGPGTVNAATVADWSWNTKLVADGTYTIDLEGRDAAGNKDASSVKTITVTVDNNGPVVSAITYTTAANVITPNVTATDANAPITYAWVADNAASAANVTISDATIAAPTFTVNADGTYAFTLTATDNLGNTTETPFSFTYTTPVAAPSTTTSTPVTTTTAATPATGTGFTNVQTAAANQGVLGDATTTPSSDTATDGTTDVKGDSTTKSTAAAATNKGHIFGLAWYWWLLILAAIAAIIYALVGYFRNRNNAQA